FTVGFPDARYDERAYARAVAARYGAVHEEVEIEEDIAGTLPRLAATFDEPLGDEAAFPTFLLAQQARRHVTVARAGGGGHESCRSSQSGPASRACSCSTSRRTCPATCCPRRISRRWPTRWSCARRFSITKSLLSAWRSPTP